MDLRLHTQLVGDRVRVGVDGLADLGSVPTLQTGLQHAIARSPGEVIEVDIDGLTALDDVALGVLLAAATTARQQGGDLEVLTSSPRWRERFARAGLDQAVLVRHPTQRSHSTHEPPARLHEPLGE